MQAETITTVNLDEEAIKEAIASYVRNVLELDAQAEHVKIHITESSWGGYREDILIPGSVKIEVAVPHN